MQITNKKIVKPFGKKDKWGYAMGDLGCNMSFALNSYIQMFYLYYIELNPLIIATIILILKIWDGINDPIMGALMDILKPGKLGKFKTYIFYGSFLLSFSGALCFLNTASAPVWVQTTVFLVGYLIWDFSYTLVNVPYGSLNVAITSDPVERSELSTFRSIGAIIANVAVIILLPVIMYESYYENGILTMGIIGFICFQLLIKWTTERVKVEQVEYQEHVKINYVQTVKEFSRNKPAVAITVIAMISLIMQTGLSLANTIIFASYFKTPEISGISTVAGMFPMFFIIPFIKPIIKKFGNKKACMWPLLISVIGGLLMVILPLPDNMTGVLMWTVLSMIVGCGYTIFSLVGWAMVSECIDYQEYRTGIRSEGIVYAIYSLGRKLSQGFGASLILVLLVLVGYQSQFRENQLFETANRIRLLVGSIYAICTLSMFLVLKFFYTLDKKEIIEINKALGRHKEE